MATFHENLVQSFTNFKNKFLKANGKEFHFAYDSTTQKYGYTIDGTFHPFRKVQASKTVTAGTSAITVTPDSDNDGIASVTVNPTPSQSKSASPSVSAQTITPDSGKLLNSVSISAMPLPDVVAKWFDNTLNIVEGDLGSRGECTDGVIRSVFEIPQGKYYGGRSARDLIGVTDARIRQLGWRMENVNSDTYNVTSNGTKDMGYNNTYRYVSVSVPDPTLTVRSASFSRDEGYSNTKISLTGVYPNTLIYISGYSGNAGVLAVGNLRHPDGSAINGTITLPIAFKSTGSTCYIYLVGSIIDYTVTVYYSGK